MASKTSRTPARDAADRRARVEEMRKAAKARERRTRLLISVVGAVVVVAIVAVIAVAFISRQDKKTAQILPAAVPAGAGATQKPLKETKDDSGIPGVKAYDTTAAPAATGQPAADPAKNPGIEHDHVEGTVKYATVPPVGGPHNAAWMTCGRYTLPVPNERAVHDLEHGAVWITYRRGLPADQVTALSALFKRQKDAVVTAGGQTATPGGKYLDLSPWTDDSLPSPVVISAWGRQLDVDSATDPRLQQFIDKFRLQANLTYEAGAQCTAPGGDASLGGRPAGT